MLHPDAKELASRTLGADCIQGVIENRSGTSVVPSQASHPPAPWAPKAPSKNRSSCHPLPTLVAGGCSAFGESFQKSSPYSWDTAGWLIKSSTEFKATLPVALASLEGSPKRSKIKARNADLQINRPIEIIWTNKPTNWESTGQQITNQAF